MDRSERSDDCIIHVPPQILHGVPTIHSRPQLRGKPPLSSDATIRFHGGDKYESPLLALLVIALPAPGPALASVWVLFSAVLCPGPGIWVSLAHAAPLLAGVGSSGRPVEEGFELGGTSEWSRLVAAAERVRRREHSPATVANWNAVQPALYFSAAEGRPLGRISENSPAAAPAGYVGWKHSPVTAAKWNAEFLLLAILC